MKARSKNLSFGQGTLMTRHWYLSRDYYMTVWSHFCYLCCSVLWYPIACEVWNSVEHWKFQNINIFPSVAWRDNEMTFNRMPIVLKLGEVRTAIWSRQVLSLECKVFCIIIRRMVSCIYWVRIDSNLHTFWISHFKYSTDNCNFCGISDDGKKRCRLDVVWKIWEKSWKLTVISPRRRPIISSVSDVSACVIHELNTSAQQDRCEHSLSSFWLNFKLSFRS